MRITAAISLPFVARTRRYDADAALRAREALKKFMLDECDNNTTKLGEALGVDQSTVWRALNTTAPSLDLLIRLRARTGSTLDSLLGLEAQQPAAAPAPLTMSEERIAEAVVNKLRSVEEDRGVIAGHMRSNAAANQRVDGARKDRKIIRAAQDAKKQQPAPKDARPEKKRDAG